MTNNSITETSAQTFPVKIDLYRNVEKLSLSVFGFSFTLLGRNFMLETDGVGSLSQALPELGPTIFAFLLSVFVVAVYWWEHHTMYRKLRRIDTTLAAMNFLYFVPIILIPFTSEALWQFGADPWA